MPGGRTNEHRHRHLQRRGDLRRRRLLHGGLGGPAALSRFLTRLHALTKADNLGLYVVLGLLPQADSLLGGLKLVAVWVLVQLASATVSQLIAHALRRRGPGT